MFVYNCAIFYRVDFSFDTNFLKISKQLPCVQNIISEVCKSDYRKNVDDENIYLSRMVYILEFIYNN